MESLNYAWQLFKYGVLRHPNPVDIVEHASHLRFNSYYDAKKDLHWLVCPDLPEFIVSGKNKEELAHHVTDTLLVYFDVPTYFARRYKPDNIKFDFENRKTGEHEYVSLDYIDELKRAMA